MSDEPLPRPGGQDPGVPSNATWAFVVYDILQSFGLPGLVLATFCAGFASLASPAQKERFVDEVYFLHCLRDGGNPRYLSFFAVSIILILGMVITHYRKMVRVKDARIDALEDRLKKMERDAPKVAIQPKLENLEE